MNDSTGSDGHGVNPAHKAGAWARDFVSYALANGGTSNGCPMSHKYKGQDIGSRISTQVGEHWVVLVPETEFGVKLVKKVAEELGRQIREQRLGLVHVKSALYECECLLFVFARTR